MPEVTPQTNSQLTGEQNPLLANFIANASLVSEDHSELVVSCLNQGYAEFASMNERMAREPAVSMHSETVDDDDNFWPKADSWMAQYRPYKVKDGILSIPVKGTLIANFPYTFYGYVTGYEYIQKAWQRGQSDPEVRGIVLDVNSPGGEVSKNFDLVDGMYLDKGKKPVLGIANEHAYSAAYSIISVADKIVVARTGGVGSIGVVTAHVDYSKMFEKAGIKVTFIKAGKHKTDGNPYEPLSASVEARIQTRINKIADLFYATVARNCGMDEKDVRATQALTYPADEAIEVGLADEVASWDVAMAAFTKSNNKGRLFAMTKETKESAAANEPTAQAPAEQIAAAKADGKTEGLKEGSTAERARISAIIGSDEAKTRPVAAMQTALNTDLSVDGAKKFLAGLPEEPKTTKAAGATAFEKAMGKGDNPEVGASDGNADTSDKGDRSKALLASHALVHGKKADKK
jgi:capsid assembly protease